MADEQVQQVTEVQAESQGANQDVLKRLAEIEAKYAKETAGLNKRNSELEKKVKQTELEKLTETEKFALERKELEAERALVAKERKDLLVAKELANAGLPPEFANRISGATEEEIKVDVKWMKTFLESTAHKLSESEISKRLGGTAPQGGTPPNVSSFQARYDQAKKAGNVAGMTAIQREAGAAGEIIKQF